MHSLYKIFPDRVDFGFFFAGGGVLIFERIEILGGGGTPGTGVVIFFGKVKG